MRLLEAVRRRLRRSRVQRRRRGVRGLALSPLRLCHAGAVQDGPRTPPIYCEIFRPAGGISVVDNGAMTFGRRDGAPFFHCHALWTRGGWQAPRRPYPARRDRSSQRRTRSTRFGIDGAGFEADPDPETNFKLFGPVAAPSRGAGSGRASSRSGYGRTRTFAGALERFCSERGIEHARIRGGVGSTIGARFADGRVVENFATEVYIVDGVVRRVSSGGCECQAEVGLVDYTGRVEKGLLKRGDNPVLMTFELALEVK